MSNETSAAHSQKRDLLYDVERDIQAALESAREAGAGGIESPIAFVEKARLAGENAREFFEAELKSLDLKINELDQTLTASRRGLDELNRRIISDWNSRPRDVRSRAEAESAIETHESESRGRVDFWAILTLVLFLFEFTFGFWIFKTFVLPDPEIGNYLTSLLVGGMVLALGFFLKVWPDASRTERAYSRWKLGLSAGAALFGTAFIVILAFMRQITEALAPITLDTAAHAVDNRLKLVDFLFQLSLLFTLIFASAFFAHWKRKVPRAQLKSRCDEGNELLRRYTSGEYKYAKREEAIEALAMTLDDLRLRRDQIRYKINHYTQRKIDNLRQQAAVAFLDGALSYPPTEAKRRAQANAHCFLSGTPYATA